MESTAKKTQESPLVERAKKDGARDKTFADEAKERGDVIELHALTMRLLADRAQLAEAFDAMVTGWSLLRDGKSQAPTTADRDSIAAIERVAHESIQFAREVLQALKPDAQR